MLNSTATILISAFEAGLILALFMTGLKKANQKGLKSALWAGIIGAVISALVIVYGVDFLGDREIFEGYLSFATLVFAMAFWPWIWFRLRSDKTGVDTEVGKGAVVDRIFIFTSALVLILGKTIEILLFPNSVFIMTTNYLSTELILKVAGALLGLAIGVLFLFIFLRTDKRISNRKFIIFSAAVLLVVIFRQLITGLQILFATGVLPLTIWAVKIITPLINTYYPMFFYFLIGLTVLLWASTFIDLKKNPPDLQKACNPAHRRKLLAKFKIEKRWSGALGISLVTVLILLGGNVVMANRGVEVEQPTPVIADGTEITIPLEQVNDGNLHRFSFTTVDNIETRFLVIKKGGSIYGTGLDACDICGSAGYYQRGEEVVCANCDVVINISTIGFPGGCNPIPLKSKLEGQKLIIDTSELEAQQDVFTE